MRLFTFDSLWILSGFKGIEFEMTRMDRVSNC